MSRPSLLIASRSLTFAGTLIRYLGLFLPRDELTHSVQSLTFSHPAELFDRLDAIDPRALRETLVVFDVSLEDERRWWPLDLEKDLALDVQLVLSYPEVYFVFLVDGYQARRKQLAQEHRLRTLLDDYHFVRKDRVIRIMELVRLHARGFRTIFDPTGLRTYFKAALLKKFALPQSRVYAPLFHSRLGHAAAVADEETGFAYLNGSIAYKAGFRAWMISTESEFFRLLGRNRERPPGPGALPMAQPPAFRVILTDWDLSFPDHVGQRPRESLLLDPGIAFRRGEQLILITSVFHTSQKAFVDEHGGYRVLKPYGGFFDLILRRRSGGENALRQRYRRSWIEIRSWRGSVAAAVRRSWIVLRRLLTASPTAPVRTPGDDRHRAVIEVRSRRGPVAAAAGRPWIALRRLLTKGPPAPARPPGDGRHVAPYSHVLLANRLLARARAIMAAGPEDPESWVHCALIAGEAKEILGGLSRTLAYETVALQCEAEVGAELSFFGVSAQASVQRRLDLLERETALVHRIGSGTAAGGDTEGSNAQLNCLLRTTNNLRMRFSDHEQMGAVEECLRRFSRYEHRLKCLRWFPSFRRRFGRVVDAVLFPILSYPECATGAGTSLARLFLWILVWIGGFVAIYYRLFAVHPRATAALNVPKCFEFALWHSVFTFLLQPGNVDFTAIKNELGFLQTPWRWLQVFRFVVGSELLVASIQISLFISVLYRRITKSAP
jgi:hypothetical protein